MVSHLHGFRKAEEAQASPVILKCFTQACRDLILAEKISTFAYVIARPTSQKPGE
jgi:hypothetical protein